MLHSFIFIYGWEPVFWFWFSLASSFALGWTLAKTKFKALAVSCGLLCILLVMLWLWD